MKTEKPKRIFTQTEFRENSKEAFDSANLYSGVTIVDEEGKQVLSISLGTRDRTCRVCKELPDWCENTEECVWSWKHRATKAEEKLRSVADQMEIISQEMFW